MAVDKYAECVGLVLNSWEIMSVNPPSRDRRCKAKCLLCGEIKEVLIRTIIKEQSRHCVTCSRSLRHENIGNLKKRLQKKCRTCKKILSIERFSLDGRSTDGRTYQCKDCNKMDGSKIKASKKSHKKRKLKTLIFNELQASPTKEVKSLFDGAGLWSMKYPEIEQCVECNTRIYKHAARGVCRYCYGSLTRKPRAMTRAGIPDSEGLKRRDKEYRKKKTELIDKAYEEVLVMGSDSGVINNLIKEIENA